jgi:hypothetical protein
MTYDFRSMHEILNDVLNTAGTESLNVSLLLAGNPVNSTTPVPVSDTGAEITVLTATIVKNGTQSDGAFLDGRAPIRLIMPAGFKSTSAIVKFRTSEDGVTYAPFWSAGTAYTVAVQKSQAVRVDPTAFWGVGYIKLSGTQARGTAVTQGTICPISVVARLI